MKLIIFGSTGRTGSFLVRYALEKGHQVTAFVRNPNKITIQSPNLQIFIGDVLKLESIKAAMEGQNAVLSAIGSKEDFSLLSRGLNNITLAMEEQKVSRIVAIGGAGILQEDKNKLIRENINYPMFLKNISEEHFKVYQLLLKSMLNWTLVCPPMIPQGERTGNYRVKIDYQAQGQPQIFTGDLADFMLHELIDCNFLKARVGIANKS